MVCVVQSICFDISTHWTASVSARTRIAFCAISSHRTNHCFFNRGSMMSPDRLQAEKRTRLKQKDPQNRLILLIIKLITAYYWAVERLRTSVHTDDRNMATRKKLKVMESLRVNDFIYLHLLCFFYFPINKIMPSCSDSEQRVKNFTIYNFIMFFYYC